MTKYIFTLVFAGILSIASAPALIAQYYIATDLGTLGGSSAAAQGVNSSGLVVGGSFTSGAEFHAFSDSGGVMTDIGPSNTTSAATAVNNSGLIVGYSGNSAFSDIGGVMTNLGTLPGATYSVANAVNSSGLIVGYSGSRAFSDIGGVMTDLGAFGGTFAEAEGLNDAGEIVGIYTTLGGEDHAFSYDGGVFTDLGTFGGSSSQAVGVNDSGLIVGDYYTPLGNRAFSEIGGVMTNLGTLGGQSDAHAVNNLGQVVGTSDVVAGYGIYNAFSEFGGTITDLNDVTSSNGTDLATLTFATGINDEGQIVGEAINNSGENVAFLLTPTTNAPTQTLSVYAGWRDQGNFAGSVPDVFNSGFLLIIGLVGIATAGRLRRFS